MVIKRGGPVGPRQPKTLRGTPGLPAGEKAAPSAAPAAAQQAPKADAPASASLRGGAEVRAPSGLEEDGFDDQVVRSTPGERVEDLFAPEARPSGVRNSERLLETTYARLAEDLAEVQTQARALVQELSTQGFSSEALAQAAPTLREQRARMTRVRARLSTIRRRLRELALPSGTALDLQLEQRLGDRIRDVRRLEQGAERTLTALQLATTFRPRGAEQTGATVLRVNIQGAQDKGALGSELARGAPDASASHLALRLLTGDAGPARPASDGVEAEREHEAPARRSRDLEALESFAAAQLGT